jgi:hypothetical protein
MENNIAFINSYVARPSIVVFGYRHHTSFFLGLSLYIPEEVDIVTAEIIQARPAFSKNRVEKTRAS